MGAPSNRGVVTSKGKDKGKGPSPLNRSPVLRKGKGKDGGKGGKKGGKGKAIRIPTPMQVFVVSSTQRVISLGVRDRDTVGHVKQWIQRVCAPQDNLPWQRQRLMFLGVEMADNSIGFLNHGVPQGHAVMIELTPPSPPST
jgi:hypothetical protein